MYNPLVVAFQLFSRLEQDMELHRGTKTKSHEELKRGNTARFTSGCGGGRVALGYLTQLNWSSPPHLSEDKALRISCLCVGKCLFESYEENSSFNSNFLPFTEYPEMCQVMSIL